MRNAKSHRAWLAAQCRIHERQCCPIQFPPMTCPSRGRFPTACQVLVQPGCLWSKRSSRAWNKPETRFRRMSGRKCHPTGNSFVPTRRLAKHRRSCKRPRTRYLANGTSSASVPFHFRDDLLGRKFHVFRLAARGRFFAQALAFDRAAGCGFFPGLATNCISSVAPPLSSIVIGLVTSFSVEGFGWPWST